MKNMDLNNGSPVVIFGAGKIGRFLFHWMEKHHQVRASAFCDNAIEKQGKRMENIPVLALPEVCEKYGKKITFVISVEELELIKHQLQNCGEYTYCTVEDILHPDELSGLHCQERQWIERRWQEHRLREHPEIFGLVTLDFVVTERCSLRCRECSNLMQYYEHPKDYDTGFLLESVDRVLEIFDEIYELRPIGGEPFMNRDLMKILEHIIRQPKIKRICIYTNGTIIPNVETLKMMASSKKVWLSISNYGKLSKNLVPLTQTLKDFDIEYEVKTIEYWTRCSSFKKHHRTMDNNKKIYDECCARNLVTLQMGKIYPCPFISNGLNLKALPLEDENCVDILANTDIAQTKNLVKQMLHRPVYSLCDYCNGRPYKDLDENEKIIPCEQVEHVSFYERVGL